MAAAFLLLCKSFDSSVVLILQPVARDMGGYFLSTRRDLEVDAIDSTPAWKLPEPAAMRTAGPVIQLEAVSFAYPSAGLASLGALVDGIDHIADEIAS